LQERKGKKRVFRGVTILWVHALGVRSGRKGEGGRITEHRIKKQRRKDIQGSKQQGEGLPYSILYRNERKVKIERGG